MNEIKKRNRNYRKTEEAIINALITLYNKKGSIDKITIKALCETADISRSTFYLHYQDLISIFESVGDKFVISIKEMITKMELEADYDFLNFINKILSAINESNEIIRIGLSSEYPLEYIEKFKNEFENFIANSTDLNKVTSDRRQTLVEIRIIVAGLIDFIIGLLRNKSEVNLTDYSELINNFIVRWVNTLK